MANSSSSSSPENQKKSVSSEAAKIAVIVIASVIIIAVVIGFLPTLFQVGTKFAQVVNPPNAYITSKNSRTGTSGLDYVAWIDVSIHNSGGPGTVVIWAQVQQGSGSWTKSIPVYMEAQGSKDVTFTFNEVGLWTFNQITYRVWIE